MYNPNIKYIALQMREGGTSLNEIAITLKMKKSTVSYWCRDLILKESAIRKIKTNGRRKSVQGLLRYAEIKRKERIERNQFQLKEGAVFIGNITKRDILMTGLGLYWGEGYKVGELGFTNSNPKIIKFYLYWLKSFDISGSDLIFRLTINKIFQSFEKEIKDFWIRFLGVKENQFSKTTIIKSVLKKGFVPTMSNYKGILRVKVRRGFALKNKILGAIDHISSFT